MNEADILPAPVVGAVPPPLSKWERERQAFLRLLPQLLSTHAGKYVAVHEEKVVDSDDNLLALAPRVYAKLGYVPMYMDLVTTSSHQVRLPHIGQRGRGL